MITWLVGAILVTEVIRLVLAIRDAAMVNALNLKARAEMARRAEAYEQARREELGEMKDFIRAHGRMEQILESIEKARAL